MTFFCNAALINDIMLDIVRCLLFVLISISAVQVDCTKKRSWLGPNTFYEGVLPSARVGHGFACPNGGIIFAFGGLGSGVQAYTLWRG